MTDLLKTRLSRRNVLQNQLAEALTEADGSVIAAVANPEKVAVELRLNPEAVAEKVKAGGKQCFYEPDTAAIVARLKAETRSGDVIVIFSNGGLDGIHGKLLAALQ